MRTGLFSAKPVVVNGRYQAPGRGFVTVRGKMGGEPFSRRIAVTLPAVASRDGLGSLWARAKVTELTAEGDGLHREAITKLGLDYRLLTPFTSFVAVEHRTISEGGRLRTVEVPVEVPAPRGRTLALRYLVTYARERREKGMESKLAAELQDAINQQGGAFKRKDDMYRMAQANKAFAHYRW